MRARTNGRTASAASAGTHPRPDAPVNSHARGLATGQTLSLGLCLALGLALSSAPDLALASATAAPTRPERLVGGSCGDCDAALEHEVSALSWRAAIAHDREPGERLTILGTVRDPRGQPAAGIVLYAHQTNAAGRYEPRAAGGRESAHAHGALRAWVRTDAQGRFRFDTVRPGSYPGTQLPQHVHLHVVEPGRCYYAIDDLVFADDPLLRSPWLERMVKGRGGSGRAEPRRDASGWVVERPVELGRLIEGYEACSEPARRP